MSLIKLVIINGVELGFSSVAGKCWPSTGQAEKLQKLIFSIHNNLQPNIRVNIFTKKVLMTTYDQKDHFDICLGINSLISAVLIKYFIFIIYTVYLKCSVVTLSKIILEILLNVLHNKNPIFVQTINKG